MIKITNYRDEWEKSCFKNGRGRTFKNILSFKPKEKLDFHHIAGAIKKKLLQDGTGQYVA